MTAQGSGRSRANWPKRLKAGVVVVVAVLAVVVLFQNNENAPFKVLFWRPQVPPSMLMLAAFAAGAVTGAVALHVLRRRRS